MPVTLSLLIVLGCGGAEPSDDTSAGDIPADDTGTALTEVVTTPWAPPVWDPDAVPTDVPTLSIEIDPSAMARLDADPFTAPDEVGVFVDSVGLRHDVALNYRGAYQLSNVISGYDLRNWKVKLGDHDSWRDRREWNLNYEPHVRQKLAYDLFRFAGLAVPGAQHVLLELNGEPQGLYLLYEDPDNAGWLWDEFGDQEGDLFKAAYDLPGEPVCWADLTWLGPDDADYPCHYNKKTNNGSAPDDYSTIRGFITELNDVSDEGFPEWLEQHVDVTRLLSYLVVSNFIANWDSYPQRPKNYWLYQDLRSEQMVYVPWDLDGTLNPYRDSTYNQMGASCSVFYNLVESDYDPPHPEEGTERPLVRRMMAHAAYQEAYILRYRELMAGVLADDYLSARVTALMALVLPVVSQADRDRLLGAETTLRSFLTQRALAVEAELVGL